MPHYPEEPPRLLGLAGLLLELGGRLDFGPEAGGAGVMTGVARRTGGSSRAGTRNDSKGVIGSAAGVRRTTGVGGVRSGASGRGEGIAPPAAAGRDRLKSRQHVGQRHSTTSDPSGPW